MVLSKIFLRIVVKTTSMQSRLKKSNKMHQYEDIYLLLNYSTCFRRSSHSSPGVNKTVVAACGIDHTVKYKKLN